MRYLVKDPLYRSIRIAMFVQNGFKLASVQHKIFPDGESYIRFVDDINPEGEYYILLGAYPNQNDCLIRGALMLKTLIELGAEDVSLIIPYFPYARQDKRFLSGEAVSARIVAEMFFGLGAKRIFTVDVHNPDAFKVFGRKFINILSTDLWERYLMTSCIGLYGDKVALIAPDKGRVSFIKRIAERLGIPYTYFVKERDLEKGSIVRHEPGDPSVYSEIISDAKCVVILDDIIATGGTLAGVIRKIRSDGFRGEIIVGGTHGLFLGNAVDRLILAGANKIVASDTVDNPFIVDSMSVAPIILRYIL